MKPVLLSSWLLETFAKMTEILEQTGILNNINTSSIKDRTNILCTFVHIVYHLSLNIIKLVYIFFQ